MHGYSAPKFIVFLVFSAAFLLVSAENACQADVSTALVDAKTGRVIAGRNIHEKKSPASLTKIMTLWLVMNRIKNGERLNLR